MAAKPTSAATPPELSSFCLAIIGHAPLPMAMVEGAGHIVRYVNPAFCRLLDKPAEQLVGKPCGEMLPEKDECLTLLNRVYRTGKPGSCTEPQQAKPHPVFWSYTMWPVRQAERGQAETCNRRSSCASRVKVHTAFRVVATLVIARAVL